MSQITITDEEAHRVLAQAIRIIIEKNTEYFLGKASYQLTETISSIARESIKKMVQDGVEEYLRDTKVVEQIKEKLAQELTQEKISDLISKLTINVGRY